MTPEERAARGLRRVRRLLYLCFPLFPLSIFGPSFTYRPGVGRMSDWVRGLLESFGVLGGPRTHTVFEVLDRLRESREFALWALVGLTVVLFPGLKFFLLARAIDRRLRGVARSPRLEWIADLLGRLAFSDVFVIAVSIFMAQGAGAALRPEWGFFCYAACAVTTLVAGFLAGRAR